MSGGGKGGGGQTTTTTLTVYQYFLGAHLIACHGQATEIQEIKFGDDVAWQGSITGSQAIYIDEPDLFGGDEQEGGVVGKISVAMGEPDQQKNTYLDNRINGPISAWRNFTGFILEQLRVATNNPYLKSPKFRIKRIYRDWYPSKAEIFRDDGFSLGMNPAHILYECLTDRVWGLGKGDDELDLDTFLAAADTLYSEGLALSMQWAQQESIQAFIGLILDHISGMLVKDRYTGRYQLYLLRKDYAVGQLQVFDESNILSLDEFQRQGWGETINEVVVNYTDVTTGQIDSVTVQNLANIQLQGGLVSQSKTYYGLPTRSIAQRVAAREVQIASSPLSRCKLTINREAWNVPPGGVFKLVWPPLGINGVVMRAGEVTFGTLTDRKISVTAIEDVFSIPAFSYIKDPGHTWEPPQRDPIPALYRLLVETPYWYLAQYLGDAEAVVVDDALTGWMGVSASPTALAYNYKAHEYAGVQWELATSAVFIPVFSLDEVLDDPTQQVFRTSQVTTEDQFYFDQLYIIGGKELVRLKAYDLLTGTATVDRALLDTLPASHPAGTLMHAVPVMGLSYSASEYSTGQSAQVKMLTTTSKGTLSIADAPTDSITFRMRQGRPLPPGKFSVNNEYLPDSVEGDLNISWASRNRLSQTTDDFILQSDGNVTPEPGTEYILEIYNEQNTLVRTETTTNTSYTYLRSVEEAESGVGRLNLSLRFKLSASRDGFLSWEAWDLTVLRSDVSLKGLNPVVLTNPGAEAGDISGWTVSAGDMYVRSDQFYTGDHSFGTSSSGSAYQDVILDEWATAIQIASGEAAFDLSWYQKNAADAGRMAIEFYDESPSLLLREQGVMEGGADWRRKILDGAIPATSVKARLIMDYAGSGAMFDEIGLSLSVPPFPLVMINAGGQNGSTAGWDAENGNFSFSDATGTGEQFGLGVFYSAGTGNFWAGQELDLELLISAATIASGTVHLRLEVWQKSYTATQDPAGADIIWLNAAREELGRDHIPSRLTTPAGSWIRRATVSLAPADARYAKVGYCGNKYLPGDIYITGYFDNMAASVMPFDPLIDVREVHLPNGDADAGRLVPWEYVGTSQTVAALGPADSTLGPLEGDYCFGISPVAADPQGNYLVCQALDFAELFIGDYDIDGGALKLKLTAWAGSDAGTNEGVLQMKWVNNQDIELFTSEHTFIFSGGAWSEESLEVQIPIGARVVEVGFGSTYLSGVTNDGMFDALTVEVLGVTAQRLELVNFSAEMGDTTGWTVETGYEPIRALANADTTQPARRAQYQFARHLSAVPDGPLGFYQTIDLIAQGASATLIDADRYLLHCSVYSTTFAQGGEEGTLRLRWRDSDGAITGEASTPLLLVVGIIQEVTMTPPIPAGTRAVDLMVEAEQNAGHPYNYARFDDFEAVLILTSE